ncbi:MAG TPA: hypothetical protein VGM95_06320 [Lactobacillaceae bacterium]|jgi:hypothetical protein
MVNKVAIGVVTVSVLGLVGLVGSQIMHQANDNQNIEKQTKQSDSSATTSKQSSSTNESSQSSSSSSIQKLAINDSDEAINQVKKYLNNDQLSYTFIGKEDNIYAVGVASPNADDVAGQVGDYLVYASDATVKPANQVGEDNKKFAKYKGIDPSSPAYKTTYQVVVHNKEEAANWLQQKFQKSGEDAGNGDLTYQGFALPNGTYSVKVQSKALKEQGGATGTVGNWLVLPNGSTTLQQ